LQPTTCDTLTSKDLAVFYSVLAHRGYFPVKELATFRQINSRVQGHPTTHEGLPGIRIASGSLGQGPSVACGMALAKRMTPLHLRPRPSAYPSTKEHNSYAILR